MNIGQFSLIVMSENLKRAYPTTRWHVNFRISFVFTYLIAPGDFSYWRWSADFKRRVPNFHPKIQAGGNDRRHQNVPGPGSWVVARPEEGEVPTQQAADRREGEADPVHGQEMIFFFKHSKVDNIWRLSWQRSLLSLFLLLFLLLILVCYRIETTTFPGSETFPTFQSGSEKARRLEDLLLRIEGCLSYFNIICIESHR